MPVYLETTATFDFATEAIAPNKTGREARSQPDQRLRQRSTTELARFKVQLMTFFGESLEAAR